MYGLYPFSQVDLYIGFFFISLKKNNNILDLYMDFKKGLHHTPIHSTRYRPHSRSPAGRAKTSCRHKKMTEGNFFMCLLCVYACSPNEAPDDLLTEQRTQPA